MARIPRVVLPGIPHHVTQRGNRRQKVFFGETDYRKYLAYLSAGCRAAGTACWAYCLMPNHAHLVLVPETESGLREALAEAHRNYSRMINLRYNPESLCPKIIIQGQGRRQPKSAHDGKRSAIREAETLVAAMTEQRPGRLFIL